MRKFALLLAAFSLVFAGCAGGGGRSTPQSLAQKPTAGTAKLSILLPKSLQRATIPTAVRAPNHGLRKHGVVKRPKTSSSSQSKKRNPLFIDTNGVFTYLQITSQSVVNGVVVASTTVPDVSVGAQAALSVTIPIYAGSGNIIVREVDETSTPFVGLAQGQQTYTFDPAGGLATIVDIALSMIPAGVAIVSSAPDFPTAQQITSGSGTPTINVSDFNNCSGSMSSSTVTITTLPIDALGTLPNGDGAVPSVTLVSAPSDNSGASSLTPTGIPGQYTLNYDAFGDGVTATFKSTDAFNNIVTTTADLTDTCTSGNGLSISTGNTAEFNSGSDTISFTSPVDSSTAFTPAEFVATGQVFKPTVTVTDDGYCGGLVSYDPSSNFNADLNGYTPVNVTPLGSLSGSCTIFFNDGKNAQVNLTVFVAGFSSPPPSAPTYALTVAPPAASPNPDYNGATSPPTLTFAIGGGATLAVIETATSGSFASPFTAPSVTVTDSPTSCASFLTLTINGIGASFGSSSTVALSTSGDFLSASGSVFIGSTGSSAGSCTVTFSDGTNNVPIAVTYTAAP